MLVDVSPVSVREEISKRVLVVGPEYRNHRGGIGAVIASHQELFETFHFVPTYNYDKNPVKMAAFFSRNLVQIIRTLNRFPEIEIVHVHSSQKGSIFRKLAVLLLVKFFFKKKFVNHSHGSHFQLFYGNSNAFVKKLVKFYLRKTDLTLTVSDSWRHYYQATFQLSNVQKLNNMISIPEADDDLNEEKKIVKFLFLGQIGSRKGIFDLIEVLHKHHAEVKGTIQLTIGGDGEIDKLMKLISDYNLDDIIEFKGWISGEQKTACLRNTDVYVLPSYNEGMPVSILEAMSFGKAIISTKIAGIPEIVFDGVNGFLFQPGDQDALWNAIHEYIQYPEKRFAHGGKSRDIVQDYTPEAVVPKIEKIYESLLS
jgi:glycosyltransferase involved in cell wall biosynthesis